MVYTDSVHIVSFKYLPEAWALIYGKKMTIDMELETTVFLIAPDECINRSRRVQFSALGKKHNIIYPILKYSTKYFIFCHIYVFSTDFAGFCKILLIARFCTIFGQVCKIAKLRNSRRPVYDITKQSYN